MKLFPYTLLRQASGKISDIQLFRSIDFKRYLKEFEAEATLIESTSSKIVAKLHDIIASADDSVKLKLVKSKRRIFNHKPVSPSQKSILLNYFDQEMKDIYQNYERLISSYNHKKAQFHQDIDKSIHADRDTFKKLVKNDNLINGLFFSSSSMFASAHKYLKNGNDKSKKNRQVEKSLLKYLLRIHTRSTPFSSFAHFHIKSLIHEPKNNLDRKSHVKLNPRLLYILHEELCSIKSFYWNFPVHLNKNAVETEDSIMSYAVFTSRNESFNSIEKNPVFDYLFDQLKKWKDKIVRVPDIIEDLQQIIDASPSEIEDFLMGLIDGGFIVFNSPLSTYDKNTDKLEIYIDFLKKVSTEEVSTACKDLIGSLQALNKTINAIETYSADRHQLLISCKREVEKIFHLVETYKAANPRQVRPYIGEDLTKKELKSILSRTIFYEDVTEKIELDIDTDQINPIVESLNSLYSGCLNTPSEIWAMCNATALFLHLYGKEQHVNLITFFEQYNRYFLNDTYKEDEVLMNLMDKIKEPLRQRVSTWNSQLDQAVQGLSCSSNTVEFDRSFFVAFDNHAQDIPSQTQYGAFLNLYDSEDNNHKVVLESTTSGYGRMFSRFLNYYDEEILEAFRAENNYLEADNLVPVENYDGFNYSINDRPRLMKGSIEVDKVVVCYNSVKKKLELRDRETKKCYDVYNLDFLTLGARSKLYQFLTIFDPILIPYVNDICDAINTKNRRSSANGIVLYPRIIFEDKVVLQRKKWIIDSESLPNLIDDSAEEKIAKLYRWLNDIGVPDQVFVKLQGANEVNKNLRKAQYVDVGSPFVVRLLVEVIEKCHALNESLIIEEMLPSPGYITDCLNDQTTEVLVQWSRA